MGTPEFAAASLNAILEAGYEVAAVVTAPDKPAGRGRQLQESDVKKYAAEKGLKILQPEKLKDENFLKELRELNADLFVVVAFRMLPEVVWQMPPMGTFNLHASLLPQYRGAAPINHAIIQGEKKTGVTTFFLDKEIDTGNIIFQEQVEIGEEESAGDLHDKLMRIGAKLVVKTIGAIAAGNIKPISQGAAAGNELKHAPKIFRDDCKIQWTHGIDTVYNFIRGLSPYPAAWTEFTAANGEKSIVKIFRTRKEATETIFTAGTAFTDQKSYLKIACKNGYLFILELQLPGKKRMSIEELLRGYKIPEGWRATN
jgi:methionyl-tRNA formyltransferase